MTEPSTAQSAAEARQLAEFGDRHQHCCGRNVVAGVEHDHDTAAWIHLPMVSRPADDEFDDEWDGDWWSIRAEQNRAYES